MEYSKEDKEIINKVMKELTIINSYMTQVGDICDLDADQYYKVAKVKPLLDMCYLAYGRMHLILDKIPEYKSFIINTEDVETWYSGKIPLYEWKIGFEQVYTRMTNSIKEYITNR